MLAALGKECREWPPGAADAEVEALIEEWEIPGGAVIFTDCSVVRGVMSGWTFTARENGHTVMERSGASDITTSSMSMEVRAICAYLVSSS